MHLFHKWVEVFNTHKHSYLECSVCGKRKLRVNFAGGYQPTDKEWLAGRR